MSQAAVEQRAGAAGRCGSKWWTLVAVCLGIFMLLLDITIVTVALPDIQRGLGSSFSGLQWIVDAYALTLAAFLLTAGSLSDMYGQAAHRAAPGSANSQNALAGATSIGPRGGFPGRRDTPACLPNATPPPQSPGCSRRHRTARGWRRRPGELRRISG
jgi:hypothetical protein